MTDHAARHIGQTSQALSLNPIKNGLDRNGHSQALRQHAQGQALAAARIAMHHHKAALAAVRLLDAPAEVIDAGRDRQRLGR